MLKKIIKTVKLILPVLTDLPKLIKEFKKIWGIKKTQK